MFLDQGSAERRSFLFSQYPERSSEQALQQIPLRSTNQGPFAAESDSASSYESKEMRWLAKNSRAFESYRGEWLLILGDTLLAHTRDFRVLQHEIVARNITSPFIYYVPTEEESNFIAI